MPASSRFAVGVHVLVYLAHQGQRPASSAEIAASVNTHPVVLRRLLASFVRARLVQPRKGAAGGFALVRDPEDISLLAVYKIAEPGHVLGRAANSPSRKCPIGAGIARVVGRVCAEAETALERQLSRMTLADAYRETCRNQPRAPRVRASRAPLRR